MRLLVRKSAGQIALKFRDHALDSNDLAERRKLRLFLMILMIMLIKYQDQAGPKFQGTRDDRNIQRAFYNVWKKHHGIKWQSIELPNGMSGDLFGPMSFRRHDLDLVIGINRGS